jgi:hypothetical protein
LANEDVFKATVKEYQKEKRLTNSGNTQKPTDDELTDQWINNHPNTVFGLGDFRRYKDGTYPAVSDDQILKEILDILVKEKIAGIRPNKRY